MADNGRPSKLKPEVIEKIVQALTVGNYRKQAALYAGIDDGTLRRWMKRGRAEPEGPYADFRAAVLEAESKAQIMAMGCVTKAIREGDWKAAAWMLERRLPEHYAPRSRLFDPYRVLEILDDEGLVADRDRALTALAEAEPSLSLESGSDFEIDETQVTDEDRDALFRLLRMAQP